MTAIPTLSLSLTEQEAQLAHILELLVEDVDVPGDLLGEIVRAYDNLALWIKADCLERFVADAEIHPQGSARLGTMTRPVQSGDDCDADLVYRRDLKRASTTQARLMDEAGEQLERYVAYLRQRGDETPTLEKGKRCWTLRYRDRFHLDVLPAIPDDRFPVDGDRKRYDPLLITDTQLTRWQPSNPRAFATWFDERQAEVLQRHREAMAQKADVNVEAIPEHTVKTPLRQAVQLLKRHRDITYEGRSEEKPISIIITTLAAKAYRGQPTAYESLRDLAREMRSHIEDREGIYWVENPTYREENFADKWRLEPERARRFFEWLERVERDLGTAVSVRGIERVAASLAPGFGSESVSRAIERYGESLYERRSQGTLKVAHGTGALGVTGTAVPPHSFYGTRED